MTTPFSPRTAIYIDGFNLYYGSLKSTKYRWLDIKAVCEALLAPGTDIVLIKYFTARIKASSCRDPSAPDRQDTYFRALQAHCGSDVEIIQGDFRRDKKRHTLTKPVQCKRTNWSCWPWFVNASCHDAPHIQVWVNEEKKTDVNIASHMINDAWLDKYDQAVLISNDTDLEEALKIIKEDHTPRKPPKRVGVITPTTNRGRKPAGALLNQADWSKEIKESHLISSQLPKTIHGTSLYCPVKWK